MGCRARHARIGRDLFVREDVIRACSLPHGVGVVLRADPDVPSLQCAPSSQAAAAPTVWSSTTVVRARVGPALGEPSRRQTILIYRARNTHGWPFTSPNG
eukprot:3033692-Prymnesium_polylepis.2